MDLKSPDYSLIEFHDAILEKLYWEQGGDVTLVFGHIAAYFAVGVERYEVWSCRASLKVALVTRLEIRGTITDQDWVSDGEVWDQLGNKIDPENFGSEQPISKIELICTNGATVTLHAARARFVDISRIRLLEEWIGPLRGA